MKDLAKSKNALSQDAYSLGGIARNKSWFASVREVIQIVPRVVFGCEDGSISYLNFLSYLRSAGGLTPICESEPGCAQEFRIKV